jgi:hypothetical protein
MSSFTFAMNQQLGVLVIEKATLETHLVLEVEPQLAAENTKRNRKAKQDVLDRLSAINRQLNEIAKQQRKNELEQELKALKAEEEKQKLSAKAVATAEKRRPKPRGTSICCRDCEADFFFHDGEKAFYEEKGLALPTRCRDCRKAKPKPIIINCARCKTDFTFSVAAQHHFSEQGWVAPVRCKTCRPEHKAEIAAAAAAAQAQETALDL